MPRDPNYWKEYYYANLERRRKQGRDYYYRNQEKRQTQSRLYQAEHRDELKAKKNAYRSRPDRKFIKKVARQMEMTYPEARAWIAAQGMTL